MSVKKQLKFTLRALRDIAEAEAYIAQDNPQAAQKIAKLILKTAKAVAVQPEIGRTGLVSGTRKFPVKNYPYLLVYRIVGGKVSIRTVMHTARKHP